jgi:hypothetical protein
VTQTLFGNFDRKPLPPAFALMPLDEMVARIEAIRLNAAAPECPTCGSKAGETELTKRCPGCEMVKLRAAFAPDRSHRDGLQAWCRACKRQQLASYKRRKILRVLGRTA